MTDELEPCPFCNGSAHTQCWLGSDGDYNAKVRCDECGACSGICSHGDEGVAILMAKACWNTRYKRTCKVENTGFATGRCSACGVEFTASVVNNIQPDCVEHAHFCPNCGAEVLDD